MKENIGIGKHKKRQENIKKSQKLLDMGGL